MEYNGVCAQHMPHLYNKTSLFSLTLNGISEVDVINFMSNLTKYSRPNNKQCFDALLPFLCQYVFPPCDVSNGSTSFITQTQCSHIREVVCSVEWNLATKVSPLAASLLPDCEDFYDDNDTSLIMPQSLQCHYQFKEFCGFCLPLCGKFSQYRVNTKLQEKLIIICAGALALIGGILVFITSFYRRKM